MEEVFLWGQSQLKGGQEMILPLLPPEVPQPNCCCCSLHNQNVNLSLERACFYKHARCRGEVNRLDLKVCITLCIVIYSYSQVI